MDDANENEDSLRPDVVDCDLCPPEGERGRGGGRRGGRLLMMPVSGYGAFVTGLHGGAGVSTASPPGIAITRSCVAHHRKAIVYS